MKLNLILYNYKPYPRIRKGLFKVDANLYEISNGGWQSETVELTIIGDADDIFVERLYQSEYSDRNQPNYGEKYTAPTGPHKSRLVNWLPTQTELFSNN